MTTWRIQDDLRDGLHKRSLETAPLTSPVINNILRVALGS